MATIPERINELTATTFDTDLSLVVDKDGYPKAKRVRWDSLVFTAAVVDDNYSDFFHVLTPKSLLNTTANTDRKGIIETATDDEAIARELTTKALVPSNITPIVNALTNSITEYSISSIISGITGATITVSRWRELFIGGTSGGIVKGHCAFILEVTDTPEIVITANVNAANLPLFIQAGAFMHYEASTGKTDAMAAGGCTLSTDTGKLVMKLTRNFAEWDNAQTSIFCVVNYEIFV